jgi:hypothetical protein
MHKACEKKKSACTVCLEGWKPCKIYTVIKKTSELGLMNKIKTFTNINKMFYKEASLGK